MKDTPINNAVASDLLISPHGTLYSVQQTWIPKSVKFLLVKTLVVTQHFVSDDGQVALKNTKKEQWKEDKRLVG